MHIYIYIYYIHVCIYIYTRRVRLTMCHDSCAMTHLCVTRLTSSYLCGQGAYLHSIRLCSNIACTVWWLREALCRSAFECVAVCWCVMIMNPKGSCNIYMYSCMYKFIYIYVYIYKYVNIYIYIHEYIHIHIHIYTYVSIYIHIHVYIYII